MKISLRNCDAAGCKAYVQIQAHSRKNPITDKLLQVLGWSVAGKKAYCPDCIERAHKLIAAKNLADAAVVKNARSHF